ncbi:MAG: methyltransferase domain-containing protein [Candidatus Methylacidiphilales bacterium]|nr:methyltransferase domain-containing protein [Candidatus Methylacidiphilales bacterium]
MAARTLGSHGSFVLPWLQPGQEVLDLGCGPGTITLGLAQALLPGRVTGIDSSPAAIETAQRLAGGMELVNVTFRTGNAYELPFEDASFDLVFSHALLEHLSRPDEVLAEIHRVLRPGGIAALCSPNWNQFLLAPESPALGFALEAYRSLQEGNGGCTEAGARLGPWAADAGFEVLDSNTRYEVYDDPRRIGDYLARQLEEAGALRQAESWRRWSRSERATFAQAWGHVIARKAGGEE